MWILLPTISGSLYVCFSTGERELLHTCILPFLYHYALRIPAFVLVSSCGDKDRLRCHDFLSSFVSFIFFALYVHFSVDYRNLISYFDCLNLESPSDNSI